MKRKMVWLAHDYVNKGGTTLQEMEQQRARIEAVEYALSCTPSAPARATRAVVGGY